MAKRFDFPPNFPVELSSAALAGVDMKGRIGPVWRTAEALKVVDWLKTENYSLSTDVYYLIKKHPNRKSPQYDAWLRRFENVDAVLCGYGSSGGEDAKSKKEEIKQTAEAARQAIQNAQSQKNGPETYIGIWWSPAPLRGV